MNNLPVRRLFPTYYANDVAAVTPGFVQACGCKALLVDIDNTVSHVDAPDAVPMAVKWMSESRAAGIRIAFISNNDPPRVEPFAQKYNADYICHAEKPKPGGYRAIARRLGCSDKECMVVGDQLFTDILGGTAAGMRTVIVRPLCEAEDPKAFRFRRKMEKLLLLLDRAIHGKRRVIGG